MNSDPITQPLRAAPARRASDGFIVTLIMIVAAVTIAAVVYRLQSRRYDAPLAAAQPVPAAEVKQPAQTDTKEQERQKKLAALQQELATLKDKVAKEDQLLHEGVGRIADSMLHDQEVKAIASLTNAQMKQMKEDREALLAAVVAFEKLKDSPEAQALSKGLIAGMRAQTNLEQLRQEEFRKSAERVKKLTEMDQQSAKDYVEKTQQVK